MGKGRPRSIPPEVYGRVFMLYSQGFGYRRLAEMLEDQEVYTTGGSVERLIKGRGPYQGRRVVFDHAVAGLSARFSSIDPEVMTLT